MGAIFRDAGEFLEPDPGTAIVEIGSDRYEGSTEYFAELAASRHMQFHSVDLDRDALLRLASKSNMQNVVWHIAQGSTWAQDIWPKTGTKIKCLYLDNFDYDWDVRSPSDTIQQQQQWYQQRGLDMNNQNCQLEHLRQIMALMPFLTPDCLVICDDTYQINQCWVGKGGGVVLYLLALGFDLVRRRAADNNFGVILKRG